MLIVKCRREKNDLKTKLLIQSKLNLKRFVKFSAYPYCKKNEEVCSEEGTVNIAEQLFDKEIMSVTHGHIT